MTIKGFWGLVNKLTNKSNNKKIHLAIHLILNTKKKRSLKPTSNNHTQHTTKLTIAKFFFLHITNRGLRNPLFEHIKPWTKTEAIKSNINMKKNNKQSSLYLHWESRF